MKKPFTAPVWFMLIFGMLFFLLAFFNTVNSYSIERTYDVHYTLRFSVIWQVFRWPALAMVESFLYWRIRYRNRYRLDSWLHCWLFLLSILVPALLSIPIFLHHGDSIMLTKAINISFMSLIILAHIFFVDAFIKSWRYKPPQPAIKDDSENLLDEFVS